MLVQIIKGTYGYRPILANGKKSKYVVPVAAGDTPIEVDNAEGNRLIEEGVAVKVNPKAVATPPAAPAPNLPNGTTHENEGGENGHNGAENENTTANENDPPSGEDQDDEIVYTVDMNVNDLRAAMKELGLPVKVGMTKQAMVDALNEASAFPDQAPESVIAE